MINMKISLIFFVTLAVFVRGIPSPVGKPSPNQLPAFYGGEDKAGGFNADTDDSYGLQPDFYPALIPSDYDTNPDFYYNANESYIHIIGDEKGCSSVKSCPNHQFDPYAPIYGIQKDDSSASFSREWKCHVETNCVALDEIPNDIQNDTEVLFLRYFNISALQDGALSFLPPLLKLHIESSELAVLQRGAFKNQESLQFLELTENLIEEFQPLIFVELENLQSMEVTDNLLMKLDRNTFTGLKSLTVLKFGGNKLTKIDDDVFQEIPGLHELHLDDNNITTLSRHAFRGLNKLTTLYLNDNYFTQVPNVALRSLPSLEVLHLTGNPLTHISKADFRRLDMLKELRLDQCEITSISKRAFRSTNLTFLDLSANKLTRLSDFGPVGEQLAVQMAFNPWICNCSLIATTNWIANYNISIITPEPLCHAPFYMVRQRITDLSDKQLCDPTATPPPLKPGDEGFWRYFQYDSDNDASLPEGRWSNEVYDTDKLYSKIQQATAVTQSSLNGKSVTGYDANSAGKNGRNKKKLGTAKDKFQTSSIFPELSNVNILQTTSGFHDISSVETSTTTDAKVRLIADHLMMVVLIVGISIPIFLIVVLVLHKGFNKTPCTEKSDLEIPHMETKWSEDEDELKRQEVAGDGVIKLHPKTPNDKLSELTDSSYKESEKSKLDDNVTKQRSTSCNDSQELGIPNTEAGHATQEGKATTENRTDEIVVNRRNSQRAADK